MARQWQVEAVTNLQKNIEIIEIMSLGYLFISVLLETILKYSI
jgi:hypothetical protein